MKTRTRFADVLPLVRSGLDGWRGLPEGRVVVVRDLFGRVFLAVDPLPETGVAEFAGSLHQRLGPYSPGPDALVMGREDFLDPDDIFDSPDRLQVWEDRPHWMLLERAVTGSDWLRAPLHEPESGAPRVVLYGVKGGVGRSTACAVLARHLADAGRRVLVVDLDLESPGVSSTLLPSHGGTDFGVVDWLVEEAVGGVDEELLRGMVAPSPVAPPGPGEVLVCPAGGRFDREYLAKLSRVYVDVTPTEGAEGFAARLERMLRDLERVHRPDVLLLDSRAGIHDLAAVALSRLGALGLLFAGGGRQTWSAYRTLLEAWKLHPRRETLRQNLQMVAALVPETGREQYVKRFLDESYDLWSATLYEDQGPEAGDAFNFDRGAEEAPHYPLRIYWSRAFFEFDPLEQGWEDQQVLSAYQGFLEGVASLLRLEGQA